MFYVLCYVSVIAFVFVFVFGACIRWSLGGDRGMRDKNLKRGLGREMTKRKRKKMRGGEGGEGEGKSRMNAGRE